jgi:hypothetical protein
MYANSRIFVKDETYLPPPIFFKEMTDYSPDAEAQAQGRGLRHHKAVVFPSMGRGDGSRL